MTISNFQSNVRNNTRFLLKKVGSTAPMMVLDLLLDMMFNEESALFPSIGFIAKSLGYSERTISRAIATLKSHNVLKTVQKEYGGSNIYIINPTLGKPHVSTITPYMSYIIKNKNINNKDSLKKEVEISKPYQENLKPTHRLTTNEKKYLAEKHNVELEEIDKAHQAWKDLNICKKGGLTALYKGFLFDSFSRYCNQRRWKQASKSLVRKLLLGKKPVAKQDPHKHFVGMHKERGTFKKCLQKPTYFASKPPKVAKALTSADLKENSQLNETYQVYLNAGFTPENALLSAQRDIQAMEAMNKSGGL